MNVKFLWLFMGSEDNIKGKQHACNVSFYTDIFFILYGWFFGTVFIFICAYSLYMKKNLISCILVCYGKITLREISADINSKILLLSNETSAHLSVHLQRQQTELLRRKIKCRQQRGSKLQFKQVSIHIVCALKDIEIQLKN